MNITPYELAQRFVGVKEILGTVDNPMILAMLKLDDSWPQHDEVAWCSAFVNYIAWLLRLPRSRSLAARSWLEVGVPINLSDARADADIVILSRDGGGHVGFFAGLEHSDVLMLGGNQGNKVCVAPFSTDRIIGVRRLA
jgi:uncharacterized protein (TIGR02594 family)